MSVFTIIRRGRQAAKEHKTKQVEQQQKEKKKEPYRHVPTHAAIDALAGAPSSWREEDRPRILEQNRRRSAMAASGMGRAMPGNMTPVHVGMPRVNSALSHVSYPSVYASPVVQVPRSYSYQSFHQGWSDRGGEVVYTPMEQGSVSSSKGKEVERIPMVDSGRASRTSSKATSPTGSSNDSTSSHDDLEMKPGKRSSNSQVVAPTDAKLQRAAGEGDVPHRLHPSRRVSDPTAHTTGPHAQPPRASYYPPSASVARPAGSRLSAPVVSPGIPPVPAIPIKHMSGSAQPSRASSAASIRATTNGKVSPTSSLASIAHIPIGVPSINSSPPTPKAVPSSNFADAVPDFAPIAPALMEHSHLVGTAITTPTSTQTSKRISRPTRPTGTERSDSSFSSRSRPPPTTAPENRRPVIDATALPTYFDESSFLQSPAPVQSVPTKGNKLSKSKAPKEPKPAKKNRWSFRSKPTAVPAF